MKLHKNYLILLLLTFKVTVAQKNIAITIDDVPNSINYQKNRYNSILLNKLDSLNIPIAIFINEGLIYKTDSVVKNFSLLNNWCSKNYITLGNHSLNHARYSKLGFEKYKNEIVHGESITKKLADKYKKELKYFRFPYNDLGKDSLQQNKIVQYLNNKNYIVTPFTIESSDWMFNEIYEHYLNNKQFTKAEEIGFMYVEKTLQYFDFFEKSSQSLYGRNINHIYLCHDSKLNADFLSMLINKLKQRNYNFINLETALKDSIYTQKNNYNKKWGISWIYRWMNDKKKMYKLMKQEPKIGKIIKLHKEIMKKK